MVRCIAAVFVKEVGGGMGGCDIVKCRLLPQYVYFNISISVCTFLILIFFLFLLSPSFLTTPLWFSSPCSI